MTDKEKSFAQMAKAMAVYAVRHTILENIHAGKIPDTRTGDYSDVFVLDAEGNKIAWSEVSKITNDEMKALMKQVVNSIYTFFHKIENPSERETFLNYNLAFAKHWDDPELNKPFVQPMDK